MEGAPLSFPFDREFNFAFRPDTYWPPTPTEETVLAGIPGTARRFFAAQALAQPDNPDLPDTEFLFAQALSREERDGWGQLDPLLMGGEYLPALEPEEVEIARVDLRSVTADAIQIRAAHGEEGIQYRVVDEYEGEGSRYDPLQSSTEPLTLGGLIELIDTTRKAEGSYFYYGDDRYDVGLVDAVRNVNLDNGADIEAMRHFVVVSSAFYPSLNAYYEQRADAWAETARAEHPGRRTAGAWYPDASPAMRVPLAIAFGLGYVQGRIQRLLGGRR